MVEAGYVLERTWMLDAERICMNFVAAAKFTLSVILSLSVNFLLGKTMCISQDLCEARVGIQKYCFIYLIIMTAPTLELINICTYQILISCCWSENIPVEPD